MTFRGIPAPMGETVPFESLHVWQWAKGQPRANVDIGNYLQSLGFVMGSDRITESEYKTLNYAIDTFHRIAPYIHGGRTLAQCFAPATDPAKGFYLAGVRGFADEFTHGRWTPAPEILAALAHAGWIYDVTPESTYFEVIRGRLFAKYQQIIGSRCICEVSQ